MLLKQFYLNCLAHASYLIADEGTRKATVVDPQRDIDQYLTFAAELGVRIEHVVLTHLHADFIAGHLELRDRVGATIHLGARAKADYSFVALADNDTIDLGRVRLRALETPGHTAESISLVVYDDSSGSEPQAVLTGDTLFVGDVGRPDLRVALGWSARDLGELLYDSLHQKLLALPDAVVVYPAHGAGSLCGKALGRETSSTIGEQRRSNYALQAMSKASFVDLVTADQPDAPSYFSYDAVLNSRERPTLDETLEHLAPLSIDRVLELQQDDAQVLDTRTASEFAAAHLAGSINVGLDGQFATWVGTVLDPARSIVIVANTGHEHEAAVRLGRIGFDRIAGFLEHGLHSIELRPDLMSSTERLSAHVAAERTRGVSGNETPVVVDVRTPAERQQKHIPGSLSLPLSQLAARASELPADRPALVYCAGGYRSSIAASLLKHRGFARVGEIAGGITAWAASGLPIEQE